MGEAKSYHPKLALAKLQPAPLQRKFIQRDRLLDTLIHKEPSTKVILVQAPAGYGKSVLLTQYWQYCQTINVKTLWLTVDNADNDIERLVRHLYASWDTHFHTSSTKKSNTSVSTELSSDDNLANYQGLLERLASSTQPFRLFFDNFESIHNPVVLNYIQQIIEYLPLNSEVIIGSRSIPDLKLGRIRSYGQLLEITQKELLFSFVETAHLLQQISGLAFRNKTIQVLLDRTEGWITAIQLAVLALSDQQDAEQFFLTFSGSHTEVAQYLAEDILNKLSNEQRDFLIQSSILSELSAPLCNYVMQIEDSATKLNLLAQNNLFLTPTDSSHLNFRYHNLFSSYLLGYLKATQPSLYIELNRRASSWYLAQNRPVLAIEHLLADPDQQPAIALLNQYAMSLMVEGRFRRLLRWFDKLSPSTFKQHQSLQLIYGWVLVLNRRHAEAQLIIDNFLINMNDTVNAADNYSASQHEQILTLQCLQLSMTDQIEACYEQTKLLLSKMSVSKQPNQALMYGVLISIMAYCLIIEGKYDDARKIMHQALHQHLKLQSTFIRSLCDALEGWIDLIQGQLNEGALRLQRSYQQVWVKGEKSIPGGKAVIGVPYAELLYERDELIRAQYILGECLPYVRENGTVDSLILAYLLQAKISRYYDDSDRAHYYLQELEAIGIQAGLKRVIMSVKLEQSRLHWLDGNIPASKLALMQANEILAPERMSRYAWPAHDIESPDIMQWRLMIAEGDAKLAQAGLKRALKTAQTQKRMRRALKIQILLSSALLASNKPNPAMRILTDALSFASSQGFVRLFLDEGTSLDKLLTKWLQQHATTLDTLQIDREFLNKLGDFDAVIDKITTVQKTQTLTKRELQTLELLAKGMRNKEIAEALFISETTTKTHLRNIYSKLNANSRTETVAIARDLGLIRVWGNKNIIRKMSDFLSMRLRELLLHVVSSIATLVF